MYVNREQAPKPDHGELTGDALRVAFSRKQRQSNYLFQTSKSRFVLLNGKYTARRGVEHIHALTGEKVEVTNLERTLIDIVVRPTYAGGVHEVLGIYESAKDRVSAARMASILDQLDYLYPYHQAIGFYMERAGYDKRDCRKFRELGLEFDFYLAHGMGRTAYDGSWRLFYPRDF